MKVIVSLMAFMTILCVVGMRRVEPSFDKVTVDADRITVQGKTDESSELVLRIDKEDEPLEWRFGGRAGDFEVVDRPRAAETGAGSAGTGRR